MFKSPVTLSALFRGDEASPLPPPLSPLVFNTVASEGVRASVTGVHGGVKSLMA